MNFLNKKSTIKYGLITIAALIALYTSYWYGKTQTKPKIIVKTETVEKVVTKETKVTDEERTEKKDVNTKKVTKIIEKPDGTKETVISEVTEKTSKSDSTTKKLNTASRKKDKISVSTKRVEPQSQPTKYRLGVFASVKSDQIANGGSGVPKPDYGIQLGRRITGPIWLEANYTPATKEVSAGLSIEF